LFKNNYLFQTQERFPNKELFKYDSRNV
jgi:hypothetical protein